MDIEDIEKSILGDLQKFGIDVDKYAKAEAETKKLTMEEWLDFHIERPGLINDMSKAFANCSYAMDAYTAVKSGDLKMTYSYIVLRPILFEYSEEEKNANQAFVAFLELKLFGQILSRKTH